MDEDKRSMTEMRGVVVHASVTPITTKPDAVAPLRHIPKPAARQLLQLAAGRQAGAGIQELSIDLWKYAVPEALKRMLQNFCT
jgi:hypothetical protein